MHSHLKEDSEPLALQHSTHSNENISNEGNNNTNTNMNTVTSSITSDAVYPPPPRSATSAASLTPI